MYIKISSFKESLHYSKIALKCFRLTKTLTLSDIFYSVLLDHVSMAENTEIILNKSCKELAIYSTVIAINVRDVECFESLYIRFYLNGKNAIRFIGSKQINHICLANICWDWNSIIDIITGFETIKHLEFDNDYFFDSDISICEYFKNLVAHISAEENCEKSLWLLSEVMKMEESEPSIYINSLSNIIINLILKYILNTEVVKTISKLEFKCIAIDPSNYHLLRKLTNLKILRLCSKSITNKLLYNLPTNLELLDIRDLYIKKRNWTKKYAIKPSIITRPYRRIKILRVEVAFLYNIRFISISMPSLEVLEVQYSEVFNFNSRAQDTKIKIRELLIQCKGFEPIHRRKVEPKSREMILFMKNIEFYVDFESLECIAFILPKELVMFDPKTLEVIN